MSQLQKKQISKVKMIPIILALSLFFLNHLIGQHIPENLLKEIEENIAQAKNFETANDYNQAAHYFNNVARIYWVNGLSSQAIEYYLKTIELNKKIGNLNAQRVVYNNIGMIYTDQENYPKALEYFKESLEISRKMNHKVDVASTLLNIANVQSESGSFQDAAKTLEEANVLALELNDEKLLSYCYSLLADVFEKLGNSEKSSEYFSRYKAISQKIQRDEIRKKESETKKIVDLAKTQVSEIEKARKVTELELLDNQKALKETEENLEHVQQLTHEQQMQIDLLNTEKELQEAIIRNQRLMRNVFILIIAGVVVMATLILHNLNQKKKANAMLSKQNKEIAQKNDLIEEKNKDLQIAFGKIDKQNRDITSSLNYAQRIQHAMLPSEENLRKVIPDSFILLKPRDIVSGDFYWFTGFASAKIHKERKRENFLKLHNVCADESGFLISAVDCTGHGVPGAFMSMIGFNLLENITRNGKVMPNEMLNDLHDSIRYLLKQQSSDNQDGMDMALCNIKENGRKVLFSGAKNPLIFISDGEINHLKGDPVPIGGIQIEGRREFTLHTIDVEKPTAFYIYSDGYPDQFGGIDGRKYSTQKFKELLLEIYKKPMEEQKFILDRKITEWMGSRRQIDDILVVGFRTGMDGIDI
jgi:serine phosphatase RsbU (regulator of sigma subunit)